MKVFAKNAVSKVKSVNWTSVRNNTLLLTWLLLGIAVMIIPFVQWHVRRMKHYNAVGYYVEYEQQQRQYEEQGNNKNGNNNNNGYYGYSEYKECGSWNFICKSKQEQLAQMYFGNSGDNNNGQNSNNYNNNQAAEAAADDTSIPTWFLMISNSESEAMRRWKEENTGQRQDNMEEEELEPTVGEILVVSYLVIASVATIVYGCHSLYKSEGNIKRTGGIIMALIVLLNLFILNLMLVPALVSVEDRVMEDSVYGWYGQIGVLMAYLDFWGILFCTGFIIFFGFTMYQNANSTNKAKNADEYTDDEYHAASEDIEDQPPTKVNETSSSSQRDSNYESPSAQMT